MDIFRTLLSWYIAKRFIVVMPVPRLLLDPKSQLGEHGPDCFPNNFLFEEVHESTTDM